MAFQHIKRPSDIAPAFLLDEYRKIARMTGPIATITGQDSSLFQVELHAETSLRKFMSNGSDYCGLIATVEWLRQGPKIVHVSEAQYQAMARVDVRLELRDFSMPYPTMLVSLPEGKAHRYVIAHRYSPDVLIYLAGSPDHRDDICTIARQREGSYLEEFLEKYDEETAYLAVETCQSLRVASNILLAMTNYGVQSEYLFPKEVQQEQKYQAKGDRAGRDGRRASDRLKEAPMLVSFSHEVKLCHVEGGHEAGESTGREMPFHWRRGHWAMQAYGPGMTQRKRLLRPPVMVRADRISGEETATVYR